MAGANELTIIVDADIDGLRQQLENARRETQSFSDRIGKIGAEIAKLGTAMTVGLTVPIVALGKASIEAYSKLQALELGVEAVAGSAIFAGKQIGNLREIAKLPGLGLQEAVKGSINLQAIGYSAGNAEKILQQFGNAVASVGKGRVEFDRAIYGVQQLANTEFPLGEDLNIIADALPQVRTLLKEAFGTSRTEELQKLKISSKQVMDVILTGLEKLPRVNGGIKNAFENLGDSIQQNLARIGKVIDDRFNISGIIDKLTNTLDSLISRFEKLSPEMQTTVGILAALTAATGPALVALGGVLVVLPSLVEGFKILKTAVASFNATLLANPYTAIAVALTAITAAIVVYYTSLETARDRQDRLNESLVKAGIQARNEVSELKKLYETSQDQNKSLEDRNKAVDQLQKQYPAYFANLSNEAILAGNASKTYRQLTIDITNASRARAAQSELDARNAKRLEEDIALQNKLTQSVKDYQNAEDRIISTENGEIFISGDKAREAALGRNRQFLKERRELAIQRKKEDDFLIKIIGQGQDAITKLDTVGPDNFLPGLDKVKKETQKQLAEIFPVGSIAELRQRAELLVKAIETSNNDIIKIRGLDKFGHDKTKEGLPIYTGEILSREKAVERLADLNQLIGEELKPVKIKSAGFLDEFGKEFKSENDFLASESARTYRILNTQLPIAFTDGAKRMTEALKAAKIEEVFKKANESIKSIIEDSTVDGVNSLFDSLGQALANGGNIIQAIGQSILSTLGSFISKFGAELVKTALLSEVFGGLIIAIKNAFGNPYVLLALGAAAVAVGAAVSASAKRTSSTASGNFSSATGGSASNNYSANYTSGGGVGSNRIELYVDGRNLVRVLNNNLSEQDRLNAG